MPKFQKSPGALGNGASVRDRLTENRRMSLNDIWKKWVFVIPERGKVRSSRF